MNRRCARRALLAGLGAGGALLPFLPLTQREAEARAPAPARRLIVFCTTTGMTGRYPSNFAPKGGQKGFELSPLLAPLAGGYEEHGLAIGDLVPRVIITQGIDMQAAYDSPSVGGHPRGMGVLLTATPIMQGDLFSGGGPDKAGWAGGISLDQAVAASFGEHTPLSSVELGVHNFGGVEHLRAVLSYKGAAAPVPVQSDPAKTFERLFGDFVAQDAAALALLRKRRLSVIDFVRAELGALSPRLGAVDRVKLEAHLDGIRGIEKHIAEAGRCAAPDAPPALDATKDDKAPLVGRLQIDMLVAAMACDLTRVGTIVWGQAPHGSKFSYLPGMKGVEGLHTLSHHPKGNAEAQDQLEIVARFYCRQLCYLLQKLASTPEGDGDMLESTLVLWCSEVSNPDSHSHRNMPFVIAGGGGGGLATGRFLAYGGEPHNKLFVSMLHALGFEGIDTFGDPSYGSGPLSGFAG
jgi:hypothetical protein